MPLRTRPSAILVSLSTALALGGCPQGLATDPPGGPDGLVDGGPVGSDGTLCAVQAVFDVSCVGCHDGSGAFPDLREGATAMLVGLPSELHPERMLVVAGDPDASFLFTKISGVVAGDGELMPIGDPLETAAIATVRAWIAGGARSTCDEPAEGEGAGEGEGEGEPDGSACSILSVRCATCHDGGGIEPDLRPEAQAALVNAPSPGSPGLASTAPTSPPSRRGQLPRTRPSGRSST